MHNGKLTSFYNGMPPDFSKSAATRYLAASAILYGSGFRRSIIKHAGQRHKAFAPELGLDLAFLVKICKYLEKRALKYDVAFVGLSIIYSLFVMNLSFYDETMIILALIFMSLAWLTNFLKDYEEHNWLTTLFHRDNYDPEIVLKEFNANAGAETNSLAPWSSQNLVIYDGFVPFVGAGIELGGWSFVVDLSRPKEELSGFPAEMIPFRLKELHEKIDSSLKEARLQGLKTQDTLFVNGSDIRHEKWVLPYIYD